MWPSVPRQRVRAAVLSGVYVLYLVFTVAPPVVLAHPLSCALNNLSCNATPGAALDLLLLAKGPSNINKPERNNGPAK